MPLQATGHSESKHDHLEGESSHYRGHQAFERVVAIGPKRYHQPRGEDEARAEEQGQGSKGFVGKVVEVAGDVYRKEDCGYNDESQEVIAVEAGF